MSGDNMLGKQPEIRYAVDVHHHEEWQSMSLDEQLNVLRKRIEKWEHEYLKNNKEKLSKQQIDILQGRDLKSYEGMIYGQMYNHWKEQTGLLWK